ncbi:hypothetical protein ASPZODRAFT_1466817 [Penicilliopsis zonata CBS 506.65]|uniref:Uncharacterized protein n=1 Tax=Penicilliopsis zonata CBS 506.65 TaxID=1073090 RepID=A0A1L9SQL1_9EURO|nr:hypothetical protein ASPZODRAFT_1466817 [Penicilliopsis zonata CBS 506.65]OJJ49374.1 hypothetical protein ASPZODRAFT_1466817 [Penicilliopsis zonata CBS 506.65]
MLVDFEDNASRREKCYTTITQLPAFIDPKQPPASKSPFTAIKSHPFIHTVEVILPEETYASIKSSLNTKIKNPSCARVFMPLSALIEGDFFNAYIKTGNILMISEGRPGLGDFFKLHDGILSLELGKESFERTGLTGQPVRSGGRKHAKERYLVEINLRLPSMLHGKKGFERIVWAFENVLNQSVSWLFCDLNFDPTIVHDDKAPINAHHPQEINCEPAHTSYEDILVPEFQFENLTESTPQEDLQDHYGRISEWLAMVSLASPRVSARDSVDPYLSRYAVENVEETSISNIVSLKWHGLINSQWIMQLLICLLRETGANSPTSLSWFSLSAAASGRNAVEGKDGYSILTVAASGRPVNDEVSPSLPAVQEGDSRGLRTARKSICWEFVGASVV